MSLHTPRNKDRPTLASARRTQLITTYGIGSLIPVESESFIVLGQNSWPPRTFIDSNQIVEPSLAHLLRVNRFYQPPSSSNAKLPLRRFPEWVSCPKCNRLECYKSLARKKDKDYENYCRYCTDIKTALIPSRFIAACASGHIQDFPYHYWVHGKNIPKEQLIHHHLKLENDPSDGSLKGLRIICSCKERRSMAGALGKGLRSKCFGRTPWLLYDSKERPEVDCEQPLTGLQRGASNVWYADTKSVIRLDRQESPAELLLNSNPSIRTANPEDPNFQASLPWICDNSQPYVAPSELLEVLRRHNDEEADPKIIEHRIRAEEYEALHRDHPEQDGNELFVCQVFNRNKGYVLPKSIMSLSTVPRLRVVTALTSFTRVEGISEDAKPKARLSTKDESWLPAIEVYGEGIFLELDENLLSTWEATPFAKHRANRITDASNSINTSPDPVSPRFLLLHSLSHAIMRELGLRTGYPATAIQERVYAEDKQAGILLFTASADSAGSLGGLTSHGKPEEFLDILSAAKASANWCTADPVCGEAGVHGGVSGFNLAACHYCMLAPEVSCVHRNVNLDRATLVGTIENPAVGFFNMFI